MMKRMSLAIVAAFALIGSTVFASISVDWFTLNFIKLSDGTTDLPVGSIAELIWSPDNVISPFTPGNALIPDASEVLLLNFTTVDAGAIYFGSATYVEATYGFADPDTNHFANGYVYTRVFNFLAADGVPTNGTWWGEGPIPITGPIPSQHQSPAPTPTVNDITELGNFTLNQPYLIPEPATWALGFLGLGVLLRRRLMCK
jgi:hypothetical protein